MPRAGLNFNLNIADPEDNFHNIPMPTCATVKTEKKKFKHVTLNTKISLSIQ